jgi:outer membrane protein assembly factor BamA
VQEWPRLQLRYGFAVAEERPDSEVEGRDLTPGVSAELTRRTLFGRAIALGATAAYQRREQRGRGFVSAPTLLGLPIESSFVVERSREDFADATLVTNRSTISWEQRFRFDRHVRLSYSYRVERNRTFDTQPPLDPTVPPFDVSVQIARLIGSGAYDTRDNPANASRGWLLSSSIDWAPEAGSDITFMRYLGQVNYFRPFGRTVLASAARVGLAVPLGGQQLIPSERFFAGGARTVRGAAEESLGPRNFLGDPAGGGSLVVLNQEVRFPIFKWVRGVAFIDAGNVFPSASDIELGTLKSSLGVGLRLATPFALIRVDFGRLMSPGPTDRSGRWTFGIGQAF